VAEIEKSDPLRHGKAPPPRRTKALIEMKQSLSDASGSSEAARKHEKKKIAPSNCRQLKELANNARAMSEFANRPGQGLNSKQARRELQKSRKKLLRQDDPRKERRRSRSRLARGPKRWSSLRTLDQHARSSSRRPARTAD